MNVDGKKIVVVGTGVSGIGAVKLLAQTGAIITLYDGNEKLAESDVRAKLPKDCEVRIILGEMPQSIIDDTDLLVISPGVPIDSPIVLAFKDAGVTVWGEIELAYNFEQGRVYAITACLVAGGCHDPAFLRTPHDKRFSPVFRVIPLFDRGVERVHVDMNDLSVFHLPFQ